MKTKGAALVVAATLGTLSLAGAVGADPAGAPNNTGTGQTAASNATSGGGGIGHSDSDNDRREAERAARARDRARAEREAKEKADREAKEKADRQLAAANDDYFYGYGAVQVWPGGLGVDEVWKIEIWNYLYGDVGQRSKAANDD